MPTKDEDGKANSEDPYPHNLLSPVSPKTYATNGRYRNYRIWNGC